MEESQNYSFMLCVGMQAGLGQAEVEADDLFHCRSLSAHSYPQLLVIKKQVEADRTGREKKEKKMAGLADLLESARIPSFMGIL